MFGDDGEATLAKEAWQVLLPETKLEPDRQHDFDTLAELGTVSHVRVSVFPDGGISRVRLFGRPA